MNILKKISNYILLWRIKKAINLYNGSFTCNLMRLDCNISHRICQLYWDVLMKDEKQNPIKCATVFIKLINMGYSIEDAKDSYEHRLIMLAWFYEMVRSGEWNEIIKGK